MDKIRLTVDPGFGAFKTAQINGGGAESNTWPG